MATSSETVHFGGPINILEGGVGKDYYPGKGRTLRVSKMARL